MLITQIFKQMVGIHKFIIYLPYLSIGVMPISYDLYHQFAGKGTPIVAVRILLLHQRLLFNLGCSSQTCGY